MEYYVEPTCTYCDRAPYYAATTSHYAMCKRCHSELSDFEEPIFSYGE